MRRLAALNGNASGTRVDIICQTRGATVTGKFGTSTWWNKIGASRYVSDASSTPAPTAGWPRCARAVRPTLRRPARSRTTTPTAARPRASTAGTSPRAQCTSFAAWRVNHNLGIAFHNHYKGVHWGNAENWDNAARAAGIPVSSTPRVGDIAVRAQAPTATSPTSRRSTPTAASWSRSTTTCAPDTYSYRKSTSGEGSHQLSAFIRFTR